MKGAVRDAQNQEGRTGVHQAAVKGDFQEVETLLSEGANPNTQDAHLQTPVTLAAERGLQEVLRTLAQNSATDINLQDSFGRTPLHWCAKRGDVLGVETLLGTGRANIAVRTTGGDTALHWAASAEDDDATGTENLEERALRVTELLLAAGANPEAKNEREETPLRLANGEAVAALLTSASRELDRRRQEEEAEAERHREAMTQSKSSGPSKLSPSPWAAGWPAKKGQEVAAGSSKSDANARGDRGVAVTTGSKKRVVIKLKKKK